MSKDFLEDQVAFTGKLKVLLEQARKKRSPTLLAQAAAMLNSQEFLALPEQTQDDFAVEYNETFQPATGAFVP